MWHGDTKELVDVGNPRRTRETAEAQAFIDRGVDGKINDTRRQSKTVTAIWGRNPEGKLVAMHDCQVVFVSYETLRRELGRARWAWRLHLKKAHTMRASCVGACRQSDLQLLSAAGTMLIASQT